MNTNTFIKSKLRLPPQGKKVLCLNEGDVDIRQRLGNYWLPIPYLDSYYANLNEPEFWRDLYLPLPFTGQLMVEYNDKSYTIDELEEYYYDLYIEFVDAHLNIFHKTRRSLEEMRNLISK